MLHIVIGEGTRVRAAMILVRVMSPVSRCFSFHFKKKFILECFFSACVIQADLLHRQSYHCATDEGLWASGATDVGIVILGTT
jgi:hypothetical protein